MNLTTWLSSRRLVFLSSLVFLVAVLIAVSVQLTAKPLPHRPAPTVDHAPDVSVIQIESGTFHGNVNAYGAVDPHYHLSLSTQVSGTVSMLDPLFEAGSVVPKGTVLLQLEDSDYRSALSTARQNLAAAKVSLLEEQRQALQAQSEWNSAGLEGEPDSPLVLREPYVESAKTVVSSAEAALISAKRDLAYTTIRAPFDAVIVERQVAPGSYLSSGTALATLYGIDRVEVSLALSAADWQKLPDAKTLVDDQWQVQLYNVDGAGQWTGYVSRVGQHLDSATRQRALIIAVDHPLHQSQPLLPGTFVDIEIPGRSIDGLWQLPSSALSQRGEIWYVTADNTLAKFTPASHFGDGEFIYIQPPEALGVSPQWVLVHPLSSYLHGMPVTPVTADATAVAKHESGNKPGMSSSSGPGGGKDNG